MQRSRPHASDAATLFLAEGQAAGEYRAQAILATSLATGTLEGANAALARMRELEGPDWPADLRFLRRWAEATRFAEDGHYDQALAAGHDCMELIRQSGRSGRLIHEMGMVFLAIMAGRLDEAVERGLAGMRRLRERQRRAPASGVELLLLAAWLLRGDVQPARELGPPVWEAGRAFNQKGAVADTLTLLAAREGRPRAAMILAGYAAAEYARGATKRLAVYRRCGEAAEAIASRALTAPAMAALRERGRHWPDAGIAALAFGTTDADAPPQGDAQAASS